MSKDAVKKQNTDVAALDYGADEGIGFEGQTSDDIVIPFISLLQALSPQITETPVNGARPGMLFNTVTGELYGDEGVTFVPSVTEHVFMEWTPRKEGGGLVGRHELDSPIVAQAREESTEFGKFAVTRSDSGKNDLIETYYVYGMLLDAENEPVHPVALAFTSTKIKVYRKWNTSLRMFTMKSGDRKISPPLFAHRCRLTTVQEKNAEGTYFNFAISPADGAIRDSLLSPDSEAFNAAKGVKDMIGEGTAKPAYESAQEEAGERREKPKF